MFMKTKTIISRSMEPVDPLHSLDLKLWPLFKYHIKDWIFIVVLIVVEVVCLVVHPYRKYVGQQMFVTGKLRHPLKPNTVPTAVVPVCFSLPPPSFSHTWHAPDERSKIFMKQNLPRQTNSCC
jgi:hypothetical protein